MKQDEDYDIALLEEKNGILAAGSYCIQEKGTTEQLEERLGISSKEEIRKMVPKERSKPEGKEKISLQAKKNSVKSSGYKDNIEIKKMKPRIATAMKDRTKQELKSMFSKKILAEQEVAVQENTTENFGNTIPTDFLKNAGVLVIELLIHIVTLLGAAVTVGMFLMIMLLPLLIIISAIVCILAAVTLIIGVFVTPEDTTRDDFAVNKIVAYQEDVLEDAEDYKGKRYKGYKVEELVIEYSGISDITSNSDDILLVYLSEAADIDKTAESDGVVPLLNVNTLKENKAMDAALMDMLYISDVRYVKCRRKVEVVVTVTPAPAKGDGDGTASGAASSSEPKTKTITVIQYYYKATVTITGMSAEEWIEENRNKKEKSMYYFIADMFDSFGYEELGGDTVCQKYLNANLE